MRRRFIGAHGIAVFEAMIAEASQSLPPAPASLRHGNQVRN
jgi:hypothetical protein